MASDNETVSEILKEMNSSHEGMIAFEFMGYADRIEAAHRREAADIEATKAALTNDIAGKKQLAKIAAKRKRDIGSLKIDIAILSDALFDLLSKTYCDEKYGRYQAMLAILNNGRGGHFHKDEVIKMFRDEFCDCVVDHDACTVTHSEDAAK